MPMGILFWILMILWLVLGFMLRDVETPAPAYRPVGLRVLLFVLLALIGWKVFGSILQ